MARPGSRRKRLRPPRNLTIDPEMIVHLIDGRVKGFASRGSGGRTRAVSARAAPFQPREPMLLRGFLRNQLRHYFKRFPARGTTSLPAT